MKTTIRECFVLNKVSAFFPSKENIENLCEGDFAPNCFGQLSQVTSIFARGTDIKGRKYVCYYTKFGDNGNMSNSMAQDTLLRDVNTTRFAKSYELDIEENRLRKCFA